MTESLPGLKRLCEERLLVLLPLEGPLQLREHAHAANEETRVTFAEVPETRNVSERRTVKRRLL